MPSLLSPSPPPVPIAVRRSFKSALASSLDIPSSPTIVFHLLRRFSRRTRGLIVLGSTRGHWHSPTALPHRSHVTGCSRSVPSKSPAIPKGYGHRRVTFAKRIRPSPGTLWHGCHSPDDRAGPRRGPWPARQRSRAPPLRLRRRRQHALPHR